MTCEVFKTIKQIKLKTKHYFILELMATLVISFGSKSFGLTKILHIKSVHSLPKATRNTSVRKPGRIQPHPKQLRLR